MLEILNYKHNIFHTFRDSQSQMFAFFVRLLVAWRSEIKIHVLIYFLICFFDVEIQGRM